MTLSVDDAAERSQPTELELSLPWKRMEDEDEMPIVSPSFLPPGMMDFRMIDHRTPPSTSAAVEFRISSPDSDQTGSVRGITNPGFVDREDGDRLGAASPLPSSSSSSAATSDVGNTNNNNRRGRQEETGSGHDVGIKDETGKDEAGKATGRHPPVTGKDQKDEDAVVSIEMHEIGLKD